MADDVRQDCRTHEVLVAVRRRVPRVEDRLALGDVPRSRHVSQRERRLPYAEGRRTAIALAAFDLGYELIEFGNALDGHVLSPWRRSTPALDRCCSTRRPSCMRACRRLPRHWH